MELSFDVMQSCAIAAAVVLVGRAIVKRVKFFQIYCIPGVIVSGLLVSLILGLLRSGGSFCLVHRPERLADIICALRAQRLEPKRLRFVRHHPGATVSLMLIDSRLDGKPGLQLEPDLILFDENGQETAEYRRIYHR